uniref:MAPK regulated corepressor interacting protein 2 n=1 Tax=Amphilophus citrinellus TaxID=61819 RepID=A0A3Q0S7I1_AMPCI
MMYTITRGPSKLVTQRRTGNTQQIESKFGDLKLKPTSWLTSNAPPPKIVFNRLNGKRYHSAAAQKTESPAEGFTPAHEENVKFVYEGEGDRTSRWVTTPNKVTINGPNESILERKLSFSCCSPFCADFVPIDLEEWWAQRFLANIANLS